jgi:hypothetical protein
MVLRIGQNLADVFGIEVEVVGDVVDAFAGFGVFDDGVCLDARSLEDRYAGDFAGTVSMSSQPV